MAMPASKRSIAILAAVLMFALAAIAVAKPSNKWRLEVSGGANSDGVIVVVVTPEGGTPVNVSVSVPDDTGENHVARIISDTLKVQLGNGYHVETDDGEDVLVKAVHGTPDFDIGLGEQTVKGVRVHAQRE